MAYNVPRIGEGGHRLVSESFGYWRPFLPIRC
jgi:hypothetical protein